jgi:hypothetical protein
VRCSGRDGGIEAGLAGYAGGSVKVTREIQSICTPAPDW